MKYNKKEYLDAKALYRSKSNPVAFFVFPVKMSKKNIRLLAKKYGADLKGIKIHIDKNEELINLPILGRADPEEIGGITFFPKAFISEEEDYGKVCISGGVYR